MDRFDRLLDLDLPQGQSAFLWGPRQTGKSTLLRELFPDSPHIDLLDSAVYMELLRDPRKLMVFVNHMQPYDRTKPVVIDEVQLVPDLMNEVHRLIEVEQLSFVMCGSSARKLMRGRGNMLGGRAWPFNLLPLTYAEIADFNLLTALNRGLLPVHYQNSNVHRALLGYVNDYLKQEVFAEGLTRNIPAFARFFESLAFSHGELVNFTSIGRDLGIHQKTVREYYQILVDTLIGYLIEPFSRRRSRALITKAPKFYLFDVGIAGRVIGRTISTDQGIDFGRAFEHFIFMELNAYCTYRNFDIPMRFWRTKSGLECDFVMGGEGHTVIEVKGSKRLRNTDLRSLKAFIDEYAPRNAILIYNGDLPQHTREGINILPWRLFLDRLWNNEFALQ